jgi:hypothetical protein
MSVNVETASMVDLVHEWSWRMCTARSLRPPDLAAALGISLEGARQFERQLMCPPPPALAALAFVLGVDDDEVRSVVLRPAAAHPMDRLTARLGPSRSWPNAPHVTRPTIEFPAVAPVVSPRACAILARPDRGWPGRRLVESVTLALRRQPDRVPLI